jgi:hypothetical protein
MFGNRQTRTAGLIVMADLARGSLVEVDDQSALEYVPPPTGWRHRGRHESASHQGRDPLTAVNSVYRKTRRRPDTRWFRSIGATLSRNIRIRLNSGTSNAA